MSPALSFVKPESESCSSLLPPHLPQPIDSRHYSFYILNISEFYPSVIFPISSLSNWSSFPLFSSSSYPLSTQQPGWYFKHVNLIKFTPLHKTIMWPSIVFQINVSVSSLSHHMRQPSRNQSHRTFNSMMITHSLLWDLPNTHFTLLGILPFFFLPRLLEQYCFSVSLTVTSSRHLAWPHEH